jgi:serine/threonine protein kinase
MQIYTDLMHLPQSNVLIADDGSPRIMDQGLSLIVSRADFTIASLCGPCRWMPPEVLDPSDQYYEYDNLESDVDSATTSYLSPFTKQSDVYSLGMTILEVLTGKAPFHHRRYDTVVILDVIRGIRPPRPKDSVSNGLWNLLCSCWQPQPKNRPTAKIVELWLNMLRWTEEIERLYKF